MKYTELEIAGMLQDNNDTINELKVEITELKKELKMYKDSEAIDRDAMEYTAEDDAYLKKRYHEEMGMTEEEHMEAMEEEYGDPNI